MLNEAYQSVEFRVKKEERKKEREPEVCLINKALKLLYFKIMRVFLFHFIVESNQEI